jgi:RNA polymerase sigma-70 factor (ECF subfamily)
MGDSPSTRPSLLLRIRDPSDHEAWRRFVALYGPLVYRFARSRGLQDADAADLTQLVFQAVAKEIQRLDYDPRRGTFRGWLFTVTRNQLHKHFERARRTIRPGGEEIENVEAIKPSSADEEEARWQEEYERQLFQLACDRVRAEVEDSSWQAFWRTAVEGQAPQEVGRALGMSVGAVYTAKSRVLSRLRCAVAELETENG